MGVTDFEPGDRVRATFGWLEKRPGEVVRVSQRTGMVLVRLTLPPFEEDGEDTWWFRPDELDLDG